MTHQSILEQSIKQSKMQDRFVVQKDMDGDVIIVERQEGGLLIWMPPEALIFRHDFAKAFWGDSDKHTRFADDHDSVLDLEWWEWNLQQQVIYDDPIAYLQKGLK